MSQYPLPMPVVIGSPRDVGRYQPRTATDGQTFFISLCARRTLSPKEQSVVLQRIKDENGTRSRVHCAVVMPTHIDLLLTPLSDEDSRPFPLARIIAGFDFSPSTLLGRWLHRESGLWSSERMEVTVRPWEFEKYFDYICRNPQRAHLDNREERYPWLWLGAEF